VSSFPAPQHCDQILTVNYDTLNQKRQFCCTCAELRYKSACFSHFRCFVSTSEIYVNENVRMRCHIGHSTCLSLERHYFEQCNKWYVHSHALQTNKQTNKQVCMLWPIYCVHLTVRWLLPPT